MFVDGGEGASGEASRRASRSGWRIKQCAAMASAEFRDDDAERTAQTLAHMWWSSRLRERRFVAVVQQARAITKARISAGQVVSGEPGQRRAMPYCLAVLQALLPSKRVDG